MPTVEELTAAPKATVVEEGVRLGREPVWELYHYEHGKLAGTSIARHRDLHEWLRDLDRGGRLLGFGWELRDRAAPDDWPGWPISADPARERLDGLGEYGQAIGLRAVAAGLREVLDGTGDGSC